MKTMYGRARDEAAKARKRMKAEEAFKGPPTTVAKPPKRHVRKELFAMLGEIRVPQKVDRDGYEVPGRWVLPGCREVSTAELYDISKRQGVTLYFTNSSI